MKRINRSVILGDLIMPITPGSHTTIRGKPRPR